MTKKEKMRKKRRQKMMPVFIALVLIVIVMAAAFFNGFFEEYGYSKKAADMNAYLGITGKDQASIMLNDSYIDYKAIVSNGVFYIPMDLANELDDNFYYDHNENILLTTTADKTYTAASGDFLISGEEVYITPDYLKKFMNLSFETYDSPKRLVITTVWDEKNMADTSKKTALRISGDKKADVIEDIEKGTAVTVVSANEAFSYVSAPDGYLGYIETKKLENYRKETGTPVTDVPEEVYKGNTEDRKIVLGWHNVTNTDANAGLDDAIADTKGMNVISPTWFALSDSDGNISSIASSDYVSEAHGKGLEVWGLVDNFTNQVDTDAVLSYTSKRTLLENNIIAQAVQYGIDGINIDFEQLSVETGDDFAQFLRELSILCRQNSLVLSVDNYVPKEYTQFYRRDVQAKVCDYVIIMGYDEHTTGSEEAGSVASIDFVSEGIANTLKDVPADKVINAIPFYTRLWKTEGGTLDSTAMSMADAAAYLSDHGVTAEWDDTTCQDYAKFDSDGVTYQIWLEDAKSIDAKLKVMQANNLAGVAAWKLTMETPDIWDLISQYYPSSESASK